MKIRLAPLLTVILAATAQALPWAPAAASAAQVAVVPDSSVPKPATPFARAHTNFRVLLPRDRLAPRPRPDGAGKLGDALNESPASLACLYGLAPRELGCRSTKVRSLPSGGGGTIAIVDAYHYPTAVHDLTHFSRFFGLPAITPSNFQVVYAAGTKPPQDQTGGWEEEEALDVEMAHAFAPGANIVLVEAGSDSCASLLDAALFAGLLVSQAGGGEVSMSWGCPEYAGEAKLGSIFRQPGVVYFAASGDTPGTILPSVLPDVVSVGGTGVWRDPVTLDYLFQSAGNFGGGPAGFVPRPEFQDAIEQTVGDRRGTPDLALYFCDAAPDDPAAGCVGGAWVYDTTPFPVAGVIGWLPVAGTSVATPLMAGITNAAGRLRASSKDELDALYTAPKADRAFTPIDIYSCVLVSGQTVYATRAWNYCTGLGAPHGTADK